MKITTTNAKWPAVGRELVLRDGRPATYLGPSEVNIGRHRVKDHISTGMSPGTVWLLDNSGRARGDGADSPCDFVGGAAA
jgi:hypothetical protein